MTMLALALALATPPVMGGGGAGGLADVILGAGDGLAFAAADDSMRIRDTATPANNYTGTPGAKLGSVHASSGMCWDATGKLVWGPENVLVRAQEFDNATWGKSAVTVTANSVAAPDGTTTADQLLETAVNALHQVFQSGITIFGGSAYVWSIHVKPINGRTLCWLNANDGGGNHRTWFDLTGAGAVLSSDAGNTGSIQAVANGFYRIAIVRTTAGSASTFSVGPAAVDNSTDFLGDVTKGLYLWGAQLQRGSVAGPYLATVGSPAYGLRRDNDPRLGAGVWGYLIEEARTSLLPWSTSLINAAWQINNCTRVHDQIGPDGVVNSALTLTGDGVSGAHLVFAQATQAGGVTSTASVYAKAGTSQFIYLDITTISGHYVSSVYDILNGTLGDSSVGATSGTLISRSITPMGGGWYRLELVGSQTQTNPYVGFGIAPSKTGNSFNGNGHPVSTTTGSIICFGPQFEAGVFASSYIPTAAATVTRAADLPTLAGTLFPLNQAEGTLYAKAMFMGMSANANRMLELSDGSAAERHFITRSNTTRVASTGATDNSSGTLGASGFGLLSAAVIADFAQTKTAYGYKLNDTAVAQAGETVQADLICAMPTISTLYFGNRSDAAAATSGWLLEAAYFPIRKTNSELQMLASGFASDAALLMGAETQGLTFSASDRSMVIKDTATPANNYTGRLSDKLGSIRASQAVQYNIDGLLGWGPENLYLQSEAFGTSWGANNTTILSNDTTAPDGTLTGDRITANISGSFVGPGQSMTTVSAEPYVQSVYAKNGDAGWLHLETDSGNTKAWFDLVNGVVGSVSGGTSGMEAMGNGWYRCWAKRAAVTVGTRGFSCRIVDGNSLLTVTSGKFLYLWGGQLERAAAMSAYKRTTTSAYYGLRHDYDPRLAGGPGYLVEEARTNLVLRSQEFEVTWGKTETNVTANLAAAPDGTTTADQLLETAVNSLHQVFQTGIAISAASYVWSIYVKPINGRTICWLNANDSGGNHRTWFDLTGVGAVLSSDAGNTGSILAAGNGFYRIAIVRTAAGSPSTFSIGPAEIDNSTDFLGDVTKGLYLWGAQLELGAFATSYIPTTTATVTRAADLPILLATAFPVSLTAGTLACKGATLGISAGSSTSSFMYLDDDTLNQRFFLVRNTDGTMLFQLIAFVGNQFVLTSGATVALGAMAGVAGAWAVNDAAFVLNGDAVKTDATVDLPLALTHLRFGLRSGTGVPPINGWLKHGRYFPRRASNAELITMAAAP